MRPLTTLAVEATDRYQLVSVQVGPAKPMTIGEKRVLSGIVKTPSTERLKVGPLGLQGDEQADPSVHGGLSKAVYAYPSEHYPYWQEQISQTTNSRDLTFGSMGENLTLTGLVEHEVYVGDELHFDDCVLRVSEPRQACFKFNAVMGDRLAAKECVNPAFAAFTFQSPLPAVSALVSGFSSLPANRKLPSLHCSRPAH